MRKAGRHKHGWSYVLRYEPEYFGKKGFTSPKSLRREVKIINVGELDEVAEKLKGKEKEGKIS
jgi:large subunit ribosomal protein L15